ncbi:MAG TPA: type II CAAX endopeptidase family protein [Acholeplasmataceae bacterium]|nr:type II CAAX endopeptidase family protein [Acholeplasmataceae bacterium]
MDQEKEHITFEELFKGDIKPKKIEKPDNKKGYIYAILFYALIMYVISTVLVLVMIEIPSFVQEITEEERVVYEVANDIGALAIIPQDTWNDYRDDYRGYVEVIGLYEDYVVLVNSANDINVNETLFSNVEMSEVRVFDPLKLVEMIKLNPSITSWQSGDELTLIQSATLPEPVIFGAEATVLIGSDRFITTDASALLNFIIYLLMIPGIIYFMKTDLSIDWIEIKAKGKEIIIPILIGYGLVWAGNIASSFLSTYLSELLALDIGEAVNQQAIIGAVQSNFGILMVISAVFIGPVIEELVFRKALFGLIKKDSIALIVSTLIFGLIHVVGEASIAEAIVNGVSYFVMGFVFGYIYLKNERNIWVPTIVHIINNGISILFILLLF